MSLTYLAAPVVYVGNLDAILLNKLGYSNKVANLPAAAYLWTTAPFLVMFTWYFCSVQTLKPVLQMAYAVMAAAGLLVAVALFHPQSNWLVASLVVRATLLGWCQGIVNFFEWEVLARGVAAKRRGLALSLAFGFGPLFAILSSLLTQLLLDHRLGSISIPTISYPWDFLILFASSALIMAIPAISVTRYIVPPPAVETVREPLLTGVFGGLRDFVRNRLLMLTSIALMLMIVGNDTILPSVVLYTQAATGAEPQQYAGFQFALRFTFKVVAGLFLGWLLTRTYPRAGLLATTSLSLCGLLWGLLVPGKWFLVSFGLLGAGELYGVYFPNYLVSCSRLADVRRNLAYANLLALPVAMAPVIFGIISDNYGLRSSIALAALLLVGTIFVVQIALPRRPSFNLPDGGR